MNDSGKFGIEFQYFSAAEERMLEDALADLKSVGYDISLVHVIQRGDELPEGDRGMTLSMVNGILVGPVAFDSHALLTHVLEEELLHLQQYARNRATVFTPWTASELEGEIDVRRKFPEPK